MASKEAHRSPMVADIAVAITPRPEGAFAVRLGPRAFFFAWLGIYFLHAICGLYYFSAGIFFLWSRKLLVVQYLDAWNMILHPRYFTVIAAIHLAVGGIHAGFFLYPVYSRVFRFIKRRLKSSNSRFQSVSRFASVLPQSLEQRIHPLLRSTARRLYARIFGRHGFLGIESRQFDGVLLVREIFETAVQSYQAYQMCRYLYRRRLIRLYVGTLALNCWITPALHHIVRNRPLQRLLDRLLDVLLDFTASVGVPLVVVWSYAQQFSLVTLDFPSDSYDNQAWSITTRNESPMVFFGSWVDAASRLVFSIGLLLSLDDIKLLLYRESSLAAVRPSTSTKKKVRHAHAVVKRSRIIHIGHRLLFACGFAVLAVHIQSELVASPTSCLLQLRPWFVHHPTCAIIEFNCCTHRQLTGIASQFEETIGILFGGGLLHLSFRHCHQIEMQPSLAKFRNLTSITFYNSTILRWDSGAAITNSLHPNIYYAYFVRTNFPNGSLPDGLSSYDFPQFPLDLEFSITNLATLPEDLDKRWRGEISLNLELSELTEFPPAFTRMNLLSLMLGENKITSVPAAAFSIPKMVFFSFSGNPVTSLPENVDADSVHTFMISLYATNVTTMPDWVFTLVANGKYVSAGRTPYCENQLLLNPNNIIPDPGVWVEAIDCVDSGPVTAVYQIYQVRADEIW